MDMDLIRELQKIKETLGWVERHLMTNEANAALDCNSRVFYSPLIVQMHEASGSLERVLADLAGGTGTGAMDNS